MAALSILRRHRGSPIVSAWDSSEPIRSELFSAERLKQHAETLAGVQRLSSRPVAVRSLTERLRDNNRVLLQAYRAIAKAIG